MVIVQHDFFENYLSADGAKDRSLKSEVVLTEIAKIIAVFPDLAAAILDKAGIPVSKNVDYTTMANLIQKNIPVNQKLRTLFAEQIIKGNQEFNGRKYFSSDGGDALSPDNISALSDSIASVVTALAKPNDKKGSPQGKQLSDMVKQQKAQMVAEANIKQEDKDESAKGKNKWLPIKNTAIVIIGVALLSYGLHYYLKSQNKI